MPSSLSQTLDSKTEPEQAQLIAQVFARFIAIWGHRWSSVYSTPELARLAQSEWLNSLSGFSVSHINRAIQKLINSGADFPPTLPEFVSHCRQFRHNDMDAHQNRLDAIRDRESEENRSTGASNEVARKHLEALIKKLNWQTSREANK